MNNPKINFNLSQPKYTPAGNGLAKLYYHTDLIAVLDEKSGYPDNGGEHTLFVQTTISELMDWLGLVYCEMGTPIKPFIDAVNLKVQLFLSGNKSYNSREYKTRAVYYYCNHEHELVWVSFDSKEDAEEIDAHSFYGLMATGYEMKL